MVALETPSPELPAAPATAEKVAWKALTVPAAPLADVPPLPVEREDALPDIAMTEEPLAIEEKAPMLPAFPSESEVS
jgi:hypothetical protein